MGACSCVGFLSAYAERNQINPDGVSYLDLADAYARGNWEQAINSYWSPLYSVVLAAVIPKVPSSWELVTAHAVNAIVFTIAVVGFDLLLNRLADLHSA